MIPAVAGRVNFGRLAAFGVVMGIVHGVACTASPFACDDSSACAGNGEQGTCEATGWCSFPDAGCESGARYGEHSGDGLAGECVAVGGTSTGTGDPTLATLATQDWTSAIETSSEVGPTSLDGSSSDPTDPTGDPTASAVCGDGAIQDDELCDDGNAADGDGCSAQCVPSGTVTWELTLAAGHGHALDLFANGEVAVGIVADGMNGPSTPEVWRVSAAGEPVWTWGAAPMGWDGVATWGLDVAAIDGAEHVAVATQGSGADGSVGVTALLDADGNAEWTADTVNVIFFGAYLQPTGQVIVAGRGDDASGVTLQFDPDGGVPIATVGEPFAPDDGFAFDVVADGDAIYTTGQRGASGNESAFLNAAVGDVSVRSEFVLGEHNEGLAVALDPRRARRWVVGYASDMGGWIGTVTAQGIELPATIVTDAFSANLHGVAVDPSGAAIAVGWDSAAGTRDAYVVKVAPDGQRIWSTRFETAAGDDDLRDVVVAPDGALTIVGTRLSDDGVPSAWLARLVP